MMWTVKSRKANAETSGRNCILDTASKSADRNRGMDFGWRCTSYGIFYDLTAEQMGDWAAAMGIEAVYIDQDTRIRQFKNELLWNSAVYRK